MPSTASLTGIGIDLVDTRRVRQATHQQRLAAYLFLDSELEELRQSRDQAEFIASRLAAKEAVIKAAPFPLSPRDFAIVKNNGKPAVRFVDPVRHSGRFLLSISHIPDHALATAAALE